MTSVFGAAGAIPAAAATSASAASAAAPSRATVIEAQRLFGQLGYPLGSMPLGGLGPRTKGALRYFQNKYGLPVTGLPDARTLLLMHKVAASLRMPTPGVTHAAKRHDAVEGLLGDHVPILAIAVCLAAVLALLALTGRQRAA